MSDRIYIEDIQETLRFSGLVEEQLKTKKEKLAYQKYQYVYHKLLDAEYKKSEYESLFRNTRFNYNSQEVIDNAKEIAVLDKEIQKLESQLEYMEHSKLFQNIHHRVLYGKSSKFNLKDKTENISRIISQNKEILKVIGYFLLLLWIGAIRDIVMNSYSGIFTKIFFVVGVVILVFYIVFNHFLKDV